MPSKFFCFTSILSTAVWLSSTLAANSTTCYWPDGSVASNFSPCDDSVTNSPCCNNADGNVCLNGNLCLSVYGHPVRGACTDQTWQSSACPAVCSTASKTTYSNLISCNSFNQWCCYDETIQPKDTECCSRNFSVNFVMSITLASGWAQLDHPATSTATVMNSSSSNSTSSSPKLPSKPNNAGVIVGSVLGALMGLTLIGALVLLWREYRFRKAFEAQASLGPPPIPAKYIPMDARELLGDHQYQPMELGTSISER